MISPRLWPILALLAVAEFGLPGNSAAYDPQRDIPLFSSLADGVIAGPRATVSTLPRGDFFLFSTAYYYHCGPQVDTGVYFDRDIDGSRQDMLLNLGVVIGLGYGTEIGLLMPYSPGWSNGIGGGLSGPADSQAFIRYGHSFTESRLPDFGAELHAKMNTGSHPERLDWYGTGFNDISGRLFLSRTLDPVHIFLNLGGKVVVGDRELGDARLRNTYTGATGIGWRSFPDSFWDLGLCYESGNKVGVGGDFLQAYGRWRWPIGGRLILLVSLARGLSPGAPSIMSHIGLGYHPPISIRRGSPDS